MVEERVRKAVDVVGSYMSPTLCVSGSSMRFTLFSFILCIVSVANALHFYLDANQKRCFIEELPTDTVVEGKHFPLHD